MIFIVRITKKTVAVTALMAMTIGGWAYRETVYAHEVSEWTRMYDEAASEARALRIEAQATRNVAMASVPMACDTDTDCQSKFGGNGYGVAE